MSEYKDFIAVGTGIYFGNNFKSTASGVQWTAGGNSKNRTQACQTTSTFTAPSGTTAQNLGACPSTSPPNNRTMFKITVP